MATTPPEAAHRTIDAGTEMPLQMSLAMARCSMMAMGFWESAPLLEKWNYHRFQHFEQVLI